MTYYLPNHRGDQCYRLDVRKPLLWRLLRIGSAVTYRLTLIDVVRGWRKPARCTPATARRIVRSDIRHWED